MIINTTRFGQIDVPMDSIISIPDGLVGLPSCKRFIMLDDSPESNFKWLQAVDEPSLAFLVMDPMGSFPDYNIDLSDADAMSLELLNAKDAVVVTTVTINKSMGVITTNLLGPIVINYRSFIAKQVVLQNDKYSTKHTISSISTMEPTIMALTLRKEEHAHVSISP